MKYEKTTKLYLDKLAVYQEEHLQAIPPDEGWSLGQVYVHLILANDHFFLKNAKRCLSKEDTERGGRKNRNGKIIFLLGGFPNMKYKMPKAVEVIPRPPESLEELRGKLLKSIDIGKEIAKQLEGYDPKEKIQHPAFGYLNAKEWFNMCEMHFRHHLRQIKSLEKFLSIRNN